jgi:hypothetical protein
MSLMLSLHTDQTKAPCTAVAPPRSVLCTSCALVLDSMALVMLCSGSDKHVPSVHNMLPLHASSCAIVHT